MKKVILFYLLVATACAGFVAVFVSELARAALLGWVVFLYRTFSRIHVSWPKVAVSAAALVLFTAGVHLAGRWWLQQRQVDLPWKLRWSLATSALVVLLFAAGIAVVGIVHQSAWLASAPAPVRYETLARSYGSPENNMKMIGIAIADENHMHTGYPPGGTFTADGQGLHSWETFILPWIPYATYEIDFQKPYNHPRNAKYFRCVIPYFINPDLPAPIEDEDGFGLSHYAANLHVMGPNRRMIAPSYCLFFGEVNAGFRPWGDPVNWRDPNLGINRSPQGFGGRPGAGGVLFGTGDGSVKFVSDNVSPEVLREMAIPQEAMEASRKHPWMR
jgi:hypothetical protein